jgi:arylsulfatase A-like enzyme
LTRAGSERIETLRLGYELMQEDKVKLAFEGGDPGYIQWPLEIDVSSVHELDLRVEVDAPCIVRFLWKPEADPAFAFARQIEWRVPKVGQLHARRPLRGHPHWGGSLDAARIQIEADHPVSATIHLLNAAGFSLERLLDRFPGEASAPKRLRFGNEVRPALPLRPDANITREIAEGEWVLRGAVVNPLAHPQDLEILMETRGGELIDKMELRVVPTRPQEKGVFWTPFSQTLSGPEEGARVRYQLRDPEPEDILLLSSGRPRPRISPDAARVILVSFDTLRRDALGLYGAPNNPTPNLDSLARRAVVFEHAFAPSSWTLPSHVSMLTGLSPARHGVEASDRPLPRGAWSLPRALQARGFETVAITEGGFVDPRFGFSAGFDRYVALPDHHIFAESIPMALDVLREAKGPIFLFLHTYQAHSPYPPDPEYFRAIAPEGMLPDARRAEKLLAEWRSSRRKLTEEELSFLRLSYSAAVHRLDELFGEFAEGLELLPEADPQILVVTSDHGESFQELGSLLEHGERLQPELLAIPLLISGAAEPGPQRDDQLTSLTDIAPTILGLLDLPAPELDGRALLPGPRSGTFASPTPKAIAASVQSAIDTSYRFGSVRKHQIDVLQLGTPNALHYRGFPLDRPPPAAPPVAQELTENLWRRAQAGRWEISVHLPHASEKLSFALRTTGEIRDAIVLPWTAALLKREGPGRLSVEPKKDSRTRWLSLLLELAPVDASLQLELPESLRNLEIRCGGGPWGGAALLDPATCYEYATDPISPRLPPFELASEKPRIRVVHHAGRALGVSPRTPPESQREVDLELLERLRALGYTVESHSEGPMGASRAAGVPEAQLPFAPFGQDSKNFEVVFPHRSSARTAHPESGTSLDVSEQRGR